MERGTDSAAAGSPHPLVAVLVSEHQLLLELRRALAQQRAGVTSSDPGMLEAASQAVSRAILTLDETRRHREQLTQLASGGRGAGLDQVDAVAGPLAGLSESREVLRREAQAAVRDLAETQDLLQAAIRAGDAYLQSLFASVTEATLAYAPAGPPVAQAAPGLLVNRRA